MRRGCYRADLIEAGLNEVAGELARLRGYGDCSWSLRRIVGLRSGNGEERRGQGPVIVMARAPRLSAAIDLNHQTGAVRRHGGTGSKSSAMAEPIGLR
jgi:hypothetical protein